MSALQHGRHRVPGRRAPEPRDPKAHLHCKIDTETVTLNKRSASNRDEARELATLAISGKVNLLRACRRIVAIQSGLGPVPSAILDPIRGVESELDDLPDEDVAALWEPGAFDQKRRERDQYIERVRPVLFAALGGLRELLTTESQ